MFRTLAFPYWLPLWPQMNPTRRDVAFPRIVVHSLEAAADKPVLVAQRAGGESAAHDYQLGLVQTMAYLLQLGQPGASHSW